MQYADTKDIRELAGDWRDIQEADEGDKEAESAYQDLCDDLGVTWSPDALEDFGNDYEPTLIRESDFELYAQELAEEIGAIDPDASWPNTCIDWERAARELAFDYTSVTFDGVDYKIRSW